MRRCWIVVGAIVEEALFTAIEDPGGVQDVVQVYDIFSMPDLQQILSKSFEERIEVVFSCDGCIFFGLTQSVKNLVVEAKLQRKRSSIITIRTPQR